MKKLKWFSYLNDNPKMFDEYFEYYKVAVKTHKLNAPSLDPYLIYDGNNVEVFEFCKSENVQVIEHKCTIHEEVVKHYSVAQPHKVYDALACFLKPEVPLIVKEILKSDDKYVLLTDSDVMFLNDPSEPTEYGIEYIGVSSEFDINLTDFNAGIMYFNVDAMYEDLPKFHECILNNFDKFQVYDQDAFKLFYKDRTTKIPIEYNYKCYWNYSRSVKDIKILHFHGLKPRQYTDALNKKLEPLFLQMLTPCYIEMVGYYNCIKGNYNKFKSNEN